ncbi:MAG: hypothetical protein JRF59_14480 [Deltaproteobacteria bacterium]|nr:hypothetical protein [Deltaproteobacteria bacterium]MBW1948496.1 hypothetical protein [Deltaproteobacteria bacterium]MBW2006661.1 hypothetical protein [Deltaproteobacteria bacterium]MBW2349021.1 hypothetical protein [Deltaproteobacteria bacterium]
MLRYRHGFSGTFVAAIISCLVLATPAVCATAAAPPSGHTRIAVVDLDAQGERARAEGMGKTAAQLLTAAFVKMGRFDVVERQALEKVVQEQKLGTTGLIDVDTATQLGRILGVTYMVTGAVMSHRQGLEMVVKIIEVESATIKVADRLAAGNARALFRKIPGFVDQLVANFPLRGMVILDKEGEILIDIGRKAGARPGMEFEVYQEGEPIKHPVTGQILGMVRKRTGLLRVMDVQQNLAVCRVLKREADQVIGVGQKVVSRVKPGRRGYTYGSYSASGTGNLRFIRSLGNRGTGMGDFNVPYGLSTDPEGNLYVADTYNNRIQVIDAEGVFKGCWGQQGTGSGSFNLPYDVAVDSQGNVYVADTHNFRVQKLDSTGRFLMQWGQKGRGNGDFAFLSGIAVGPSDEIYTVDAKLNRVQVFSPEGRHLRSWGQKGKGSGDFAAPMGIDVGPEGTVFVADSKMRRVQKFDAEGKFLAVLTGKLIYPTDVAVDRASGNLWVLDGAGCYFYEMSPSGQTLRSFGGPGAGNGQFVKPYGICADDLGNVYVADTGNSRVQKYSR